MAQEVAADQLGDEFKGYVVRITGGNDVRVACSLTLGVCIAQVTDAIYSQLLSLSHPSRLGLDSPALPPRHNRPTNNCQRANWIWLDAWKLDAIVCGRPVVEKMRRAAGGVGRV